MEEEPSFKIANGRSKISATTNWINNKERKLFNQLRKKPFVVRFNKHKKAKGENKIKTLVRIYRNVKWRTSVKEEIESILVKRPSIEKMLKFLEISLVSKLMNEEKEIGLLKIWFPKLQIKSDMS